MAGALRKSALARIEHQCDTSGVHLDAAEPQGIQIRRRYERYIPLAGEPCCQLPRLVPTGRRQVLDSDDGCTTRADWLELCPQPFPILRGNLTVRAGLAVPARIDRLRSDRCHQPIEFLDHFEAAVEEKLQSRSTLV